MLVVSQKMILTQPIKSREPFFTGWDTDSAVYDSGCPHCKVRLQITFKEMLNAAWGKQDRLDELCVENLAKLFDISLSNISMDKGMPFVVARTCKNCNKISFFHFDFRETSNSVYSISLRAAAVEE